MTDREKVIKGLECHKRAMYGSIDEHGHACNLCPYKDMDNTCRPKTEGNLIADALALLKAQEPRVMTISDFKDEGVYYLEALPPFVLRPVIYRLDHSDPRHYNFVWKYDQFTWNTDEYGKTWRC